MRTKFGEINSVEDFFENKREESDRIGKGFNYTYKAFWTCKICGDEIIGKALRSCGSGGDNWITRMAQEHIELHKTEALINLISPS